MRPQAEHFFQAVQQAVQIKVLGLQRGAASLDLGHFQHVVDQAQQVLAAAANDFQVFALLCAQAPVTGHQLRKAQDGVEGRAQFVAHVRQKGALGAIGCLCRLRVVFRDAARLLGGFFGLEQFLFRLLAGGNVLVNARHAQRLAVLVAQDHLPPQQDPGPRARLGTHAMFHLIERRFSQSVLSPGLFQFGQIVGVNQLLPACVGWLYLAVLVAQGFCPVADDDRFSGGYVLVPETYASALHRQFERLFALAQRVPGPRVL